MRGSMSMVFALVLVGCPSAEPDSIYEPANPDGPIQGEPDPTLTESPDALVESRFPTGSTTVLVDPDDQSVYSVNTDAGTLTRTHPDAGTQLEIAVGNEPSRVARFGNHLYVTLRGDRQVAVLDTTDLVSGVRERIDVGAEPVGIVIRENGERIYVAVSQQNEVVELDGSTHAILRRFHVSGEPRYLALHPSGTHLYVGLGRGEVDVHHIDLVTGLQQAFPMVPRERFDMFTGESAPLDARVTGDLAVTPDGSKLLVPTLYIDTTTPVLALSSVEEIPQPDPAVDPFEGGGEGGYGGGDPVDRVTPTVVEVALSSGEPDVNAQRPLFVTAAVFAPSGMGELVGSYISSVTPSPDGLRYAVTMEASQAVMLLDPRPSNAPFDIAIFDPFMMNGGEGIPMPFPADFITEMGFDVPRMTALEAGPGVNGAAFASSQRLFANAVFAGRLVEPDVPAAIAEQSSGGISFDMAPARAHWTTTTFQLPAQVALGRDLFYSARDAGMGGSGVSCSTCHFEGRNDGITWTFDDGPRQTPSLAGVVSDTAPVTWRSDVPSVQDEADITTQGRLGGPALSQAQLDAIAAFVDFTRIPDLPEQDTQAVERGSQLFTSAGCAACHTGERFTDNGSYAINTNAVNTPSLTGVAATAPYFHDGSAPTLRAVLERSANGAMGSTAGMDDAALDDLEAYLRSL